jgi:cytochrome b561
VVGTPAVRAVAFATPGRLGDALGRRYPIILYGPLHLPGIAPHNITLYAVLRISHSILAFLLFVTFTAHMSAVLFHTLVLRDRLIDRMALWPTKSAAVRAGIRSTHRGT